MLQSKEQMNKNFPPRNFAFLEQAMQNFSSINRRAINCWTQPYNIHWFYWFVVCLGIGFRFCRNKLSHPLYKIFSLTSQAKSDFILVNSHRRFHFPRRRLSQRWWAGGISVHLSKALAWTTMRTGQLLAQPLPSRRHLSRGRWKGYLHV